MKKGLFATLMIMVILLVPGTAWAIFTPPGPTPYSKEDITEASRIINGLKWDISQASKGIIKLTIPNMNKNYWVMVDKDTGPYVGVEAYLSRFFDNYDTQGVGKTLTFTGVHKPVGFYVYVASKLTARGLAHEIYVYTPGKGVKYIPPKDRKTPVGDENNNIIGWRDAWGNSINEDGTPINKEPKPVVNYPFKDINGHWAVNEIVSLKDAGFINGYPDGRFKPENTITRAEFIVMLGRILDKKYPDATVYNYENLFIDDVNHWSYKEALNTFKYMQSINITHIFQDDFNPDQPINREEVVAVLDAILKNHKGFQYKPNAYLVFSDANTSYFLDSITFSSKYNLVNGYPDGTFKPKNTITRAEISAVLVRMLGKL